MNSEETGSLIEMCAATYRQDANPNDPAIWMATMGDLPFGLVRDALVEWMRTSPYWPRPADLRERARLIVQQRERAKRKQLTDRGKVPVGGDRARTGANMIRHVLGRLKDAGSDPANGKFLGKERCADIADEAIAEWLDRTKPPA